MLIWPFLCMQLYVSMIYDMALWPFMSVSLYVVTDQFSIEQLIFGIEATLSLYCIALNANLGISKISAIPILSQTTTATTTTAILRLHEICPGLPR